MSFRIGQKVMRVDGVGGVGEVVAVSLLADYILVRWHNGLALWYEDFDLEEEYDKI